jgi:hypothetical protein
VRALTQHTRSLTVLDLSSARKLSRKAIYSLVAVCSKLTTLDVYDRAITEAEAAALSEGNLISRRTVTRSSGMRR